MKTMMLKAKILNGKRQRVFFHKATIFSNISVSSRVSFLDLHVENYGEMKKKSFKIMQSTLKKKLDC